MNRLVKHTLSMLLLLLAGTAVAYAQLYPERKYVRRGNREYDSQKFADAERNYRQALIKDTTSVEGAYNLAEAQYATEQFSAAENTLQALVKNNKRMTPAQAADAYYNLGNAQFQQKKLQEALESYKQSMRRNPSDLQTKYNYAYVKKLLEENKDNQNQDQQNQDDQQQQNQDQQQQNQNNQNQDQDKNQDQQQNQNDSASDQPKPQPSGQQPEKREANPQNEQVLNAVQQAEDKTREKVDAQKVKAVGRSGKNW